MDFLMNREHDDMPKWLKGIAMIFVFAQYILFAFMPMYATYKDVKADKLFWAFVDMGLFPIGIVRGVMYLFGWL